MQSLFSLCPTQAVALLMCLHMHSCSLGFIQSASDDPMQGVSKGAGTPQGDRSAHQIEVQLQLAGIVAAAVHAGLISVYEGVCDIIDASSPVVHDLAEGTNAETEYLTNDFAQRSRCIAEQYMSASMPGANQHNFLSFYL